MFKNTVYVTEIETRKEKENGIFKILNEKYNQRNLHRKCNVKSILKKNVRKKTMCECNEQRMRDDFWYPNWEKEVQTAREKTNLWLWYRVARKLKSPDYLKFALKM